MLSEKEEEDFLENIPKEMQEHLICFALHDGKFPGYMMIEWHPSVPLYINNEKIKLKTWFDSPYGICRPTFLPNECAFKLVRQQLAEDPYITKDITNKFEQNGPALTENVLITIYTHKHSSAIMWPVWGMITGHLVQMIGFIVLKTLVGLQNK